MWIIPPPFLPRGVVAALIRHLRYCTLEEETLLGTLLRRQLEERTPRDPGLVRVPSGPREGGELLEQVQYDGH